MLLSLVLLWLSLFQGPNCGCEQKPEINVLAVVNGVKITRKDLSIETLTQISLTQDTVIVARSRQLELKINDLLLEMEAKRRGITTTELLETGVTSKITPPTEAEAKAIYEQSTNRDRGSFNSVKNNIMAQLRAERVAARVREFATTLRAGAKIEIVSPADGEVQGWNHDEKADRFPVDMPLNRARSDDYDALLLPGGVRNPDQLRMSMRAVEFVDGFFVTGKPVAAICHAPWLLIETEVIKGRNITSWPSLKTDLANAGARWVDREVVVDDGLITSRKPQDIPAFNKKMIEEFAAGRHTRRQAA